MTDSIVLTDGPRREREIINEGDGLLHVYSCPGVLLATLHAGECATFLPVDDDLIYPHEWRLARWMRRMKHYARREALAR